MSNVRVHKQPQGTVDVLVGQMHLKTFGGHQAEEAAEDWATQLRTALGGQDEPKESDTNVVSQSGGNTDGRDAGEDVGKEARGYLRSRR